MTAKQATEWEAGVAIADRVSRRVQSLIDGSRALVDSSAMAFSPAASDVALAAMLRAAERDATHLAALLLSLRERIANSHAAGA